ncbi:MAG TPA: enolase C-terminal domain-like protein, partial [Longimicrobiales bacterium]|nr:enolase C-terminal domain-like protein [Longimicrobiales bacterium]
QVGLPLASLLGSCRRQVPVYGSGGFTSYDESSLRDQLGAWAEEGFGMVKMKVGRDPEADRSRVAAAREAIGDEVELFVDANGAYDRKQAMRFAEIYAALGVTWFEEPVSSDDLEGLRLLRDRAPAGMDITAGEYGYDLFYLRRMIAAGAVDVLQVDATRCGGISGFLEAGALCWADNLPMSSHCAPAVHLHVACSVPRLRHMEYFHDHVRIEQRLFEGVPKPVDGLLAPDLSRPGSGWELRKGEAEEYRVR